MDSKKIIDWMGLQPNPDEGGYFASTYSANLKINGKDLPGFAPIPKGGAPRSLCDAIYYFLDSSGCSVMHQVTGDMVYHFYSGDPVQMLLLYPDGAPNQSEICLFGNDLAAGHSPMKVIPGGTWLGSRLTPGGNYALMGVTMSPGFNPVDYKIAERKKLLLQYPDQRDMIIALTR